MSEVKATEQQDVLIFLRHDTCENHDKCEPCKGVRRMAIAEIERLRGEVERLNKLSDLMTRACSNYFDEVTR